MIKTATFTFALCLAASSASSYPWEDVLLPIHKPAPVPGAYGSTWQTELWARNSADAPALIDSCGICPLPGTGPGYQLPARSTKNLDWFGTTKSPGYLLQLDPALADSVHFSLRLYERSGGVVRQGIELPVVRERNFLRHPVELVNVPSGLGVRIALRVYDVRAFRGRQIRMEILPFEGEAVIAERILTLDAERIDPEPEPSDSVPTFAEILSLADEFPQIRGVEKLRIRLTPLTPDLEYWAFASITDVETQYVTLVTPQ